MSFTVLVVAKAPVPGLVKTRLAADVGPERAAEIAAASLLDTVAAARSTGVPCQLALAGDLTRAVRGTEIAAAIESWTVTPQHGDDLGARLAHAHAAVAGPVVQIGMDTPQVTGSMLADLAAGLADADAVLAPAVDGGWWALALRDPASARVLTTVPMSTPTTCADTRSALEQAGLTVASAPLMRDLDHLSDLAAVVAASEGGHLVDLAQTKEIR